MEQSIVKQAQGNGHGYTEWYTNAGETPLTLSELIEILSEIRAKEGDLNVYKWSDGIPKTIKTVELQSSSDGKQKGVFLEL